MLDCNAREQAVTAALLMLHGRRGYKTSVPPSGVPMPCFGDVDECCVQSEVRRQCGFCDESPLTKPADEAIRASTDVPSPSSNPLQISANVQREPPLRRVTGLAPMASAPARRNRVVLFAGLLACICCIPSWAAASDASIGEAPLHYTAVATVDAGDCDAVVDTFLAKRSKMPKLTPESHNHMLYFLHIPRTAGRTYHACFLK